MRSYTRNELLALTPGHYLAAGYLDDSGHARGELATDYATAAATQLLAADVPAQELAFTYEALRFILSSHDGPTRERAHAALAEALETVTRMTRQTNNEGLVRWLDECVAAIRQPADIEAMLQHMQAVLRLYTVIASIPEPDPSDGSSAVSSPERSSP